MINTRGRQSFRLISFSIAAVALPLALGGCDWGGSRADRETGPDLSNGATDTQQTRLDEANEAKAAGDYTRAMALFREILAENPTVTTAYLGLGDIYMELKQYENAEPNYSRAARLEPRNFDAQYGHGLALQMLNRFVDAVKAYHRALVIRPDSADANLNMGTTYLQMGEPAMAESFARKAVEADPDNGPAWANLGTVYDQLGRYSEAIEAFRTAMELMEPSQELRMNLVLALAKDQRYQETINAAETVNRIEPNPNAYERMGWAYFRLREYDLSQEAYRQAVEIDPNHWVSWNGIGVNALNQYLLSKKRDTAARDEAGEALRQSLRINPDQDKILQLVSTYRL